MSLISGRENEGNVADAGALVFLQLGGTIVVQFWPTL
jgi:hypothetical protein